MPENFSGRVIIDSRQFSKQPDKVCFDLKRVIQMYFHFLMDFFFTTKILSFLLQSFLQALKIYGIHVVDQTLAFYKKEQTAFTIQILHC